MATDNPPADRADAPARPADAHECPPPATATEPGQSAALLNDAAAGRELVDGIGRAVAPVMQQVAWAEAEIEQATQQHPAHADELFHAFMLLKPTADAMRTEFVYRSHCRELLARVVADEDTRAPTHAEVAAACCEISLARPLTIAGFTVYMRAWVRAFPDKLHIFGDAIDPYEYVAGTEADSLEGPLRQALTVDDRALRDVSCRGRHHDTPAPTCPFYTPD